MVFLGNDVQIADINKGNGILSIDTTYNLCDNWLTDSSYKNKRFFIKCGKTTNIPWTTNHSFSKGY